MKLTRTDFICAGTPFAASTVTLPLLPISAGFPGAKLSLLGSAPPDGDAAADVTTMLVFAVENGSYPGVNDPRLGKLPSPVGEGELGLDASPLPNIAARAADPARSLPEYTARSRAVEPCRDTEGERPGVPATAAAAAAGVREVRRALPSLPPVMEPLRPARPCTCATCCRC